MNFIQRKSKLPPYAANSTGHLRGKLNLGAIIGRVHLYEAIGEARTIFADKLGHAIIMYLNDNSDKLQYSASCVDLSLFMFGKSPNKTKPIVMFVSEDKQVRTAALHMINKSGILEDYPGFYLGQMPLKAEFENLRPLGSQSETVGTIHPELASFSVPDEPIEVFAEAGSSGVRRLKVKVQHSPTNTTRSATAGGMVSFRGSYMLHSVSHFLEMPETVQDVVMKPQTPIFDASEDECEIIGLSDDDEDEDDELVDITSRGSATPVISDPGSIIGSLPDSEAQGTSIFSSRTFKHQDAQVLALQSRLERLRISEESSSEATCTRSGVIMKVGEVALASPLLDSAFVRVEIHDPSVNNFETSWLRDTAIPLESYQDHIETRPTDAPIKTTTPDGGTIGGSLSGTPSFVRLPGSRTFQEVFVAVLNQPLVLGDCGSWVRNASTGKLLGHVIAGSTTTGLVLVIPAARVFAEVLGALSTRGVKYLKALLADEEAPRPPTPPEPWDELDADPQLPGNDFVFHDTSGPTGGIESFNPRPKSWPPQPMSLIPRPMSRPPQLVSSALLPLIKPKRLPRVSHFYCADETSSWSRVETWLLQGEQNEQLLSTNSILTETHAFEDLDPAVLTSPGNSATDWGIFDSPIASSNPPSSTTLTADRHRVLWWRLSRGRGTVGSENTIGAGEACLHIPGVSPTRMLQLEEGHQRIRADSPEGQELACDRGKGTELRRNPLIPPNQLHHTGATLNRKELHTQHIYGTQPVGAPTMHGGVAPKDESSSSNRGDPQPQGTTHATQIRDTACGSAD